MTRFRGALVLSLLALAAAGCGDGGVLTKDELVAKADAICADANKAIDGMEQPRTPAALREYATKAAELADRQVDKLKALQPPADVEADWQEAMRVLSQQVTLARNLADSADDQGKLQQIVEEGQKLTEKSDAIAKKIGLKQCGD